MCWFGAVEGGTTDMRKFGGDEMRFESVDEKTFDEYQFEDFEVGETVFLSREEAEKALKEREK